MEYKEKQNEKEKGKKEKTRIVYAKICPRCKSVNIKITHQGALSGLVAIGVPTIYKCMDCGFSAPFFPEVKMEIPKKKEK